MTSQDPEWYEPEDRTKQNNGDVETTYEELYKRYGWHNGTVTTAFKHLIERELLVRTRDGRGSGGKLCSLVAVPWWEKGVSSRNRLIPER